MTKDRLRKLIGENIRNERISRNMSIDELSELLGFSSSFVGLMERGRRGVTAYNIYRLAELFEFGVENLFAVPSSQMAIMNDTDNLKLKRTKLLTLAHNLTEAELEFVIMTVKNLKTMRAVSNSEDSEMQDDDEE